MLVLCGDMATGVGFCCPSMGGKDLKRAMESDWVIEMGKDLNCTYPDLTHA